MIIIYIALGIILAFLLAWFVLPIIIWPALLVFYAVFQIGDWIVKLLKRRYKVVLALVILYLIAVALFG